MTVNWVRLEFLRAGQNQDLLPLAIALHGVSTHRDSCPNKDRRHLKGKLVFVRHIRIMASVKVAFAAPWGRCVISTCVDVTSQNTL